MQFRTWLEAIDREEARSIVVDALGVGNLDKEEQGKVLGSTVEQQPGLRDKLFSYSELRPFQAQIDQFLATHHTANLTELIHFLTTLGKEGVPDKRPEDLERDKPPAEPSVLGPEAMPQNGLTTTTF